MSADDLKLAVKLAIAPRGIFMNTPQDDEEMMVRPIACTIVDEHPISKHQGAMSG